MALGTPQCHIDELDVFVVGLGIMVAPLEKRGKRVAGLHGVHVLKGEEQTDGGGVIDSGCATPPLLPPRVLRPPSVVLTARSCG